MEEMNYKEIAAGWAFCQQAGCPKAGDCLRFKACMSAPAEMTRWLCVLPNALKDGECQYFRKAEKKRMAKGLNGILASVSDKQKRHDIRMALTELLGSKGTYYRYKDGERWMSPELQQAIKERLQQIGHSQEVAFDEYAEAYDFTTGDFETSQAVGQTQEAAAETSQAVGQTGEHD